MKTKLAIFTVGEKGKGSGAVGNISENFFKTILFLLELGTFGLSGELPKDLLSN